MNLTDGNMTKNTIAIIGGGAAGLFAAACVDDAENNEVTVFEKNAFTGKKLLITGKGRCNVTNACPISDFFKNVPVNPRFMYSAFNNFTNEDTMALFENIGVELKVERGGRVFPASDKASDIRDALLRKARSIGTRFVFEQVKEVKKVEKAFIVNTDKDSYRFDKIILATGGVSYPLTGSTGDGYKIAEGFGHTVIPPKPSLVPLVCKEKYCAELMGLSLKNVGLKIVDKRNGKIAYDDFGEMLFTHYGVSGPMILSASSHLRDIGNSNGAYTAHIDLKPALDRDKLDKRLLSDFLEFKNKDFQNSLSSLLPSKLIPVIVRLSGIDKHKKVNEITRDERKRLAECLKDLPLTLVGTRPISEAIITSGGVSTSEIDPKTMESKLIDGLYFAGEVIDVDAYTGGFNLQIAFSTAKAAISAAQNQF